MSNGDGGTNGGGANGLGQRGARVLAFLFDNSAFLMLGALAALVWANLDHASYEHLAHDKTFHFIVNDVLMALFFAIAAKEVWEALLPGGQLSSLRTAGTPLIATLGGMTGPAVLYALGAVLFDVPREGAPRLIDGWAVPMATDIAFSYMVARLVFGGRHPAIPFLLLLAIADDAGGLIVLAIFYPQGEIRLFELAALVGAALAISTAMRVRFRLRSHWWYMIPMVISWIGFYRGGIHPALGFVPIIPTLPHAAKDLGLFAEDKEMQSDTLNAFRRWWRSPVELILGLFGLVNAGVALSSVGLGTGLVAIGLIAGKPLGIFVFTVFIGQKLLGLTLPQGMGMRELLVLGVTAGIGFTVALFVSVAAFPLPAGGPELAASRAVLDEVKMGALLSFGAAFFALALGKALGVQRMTDEPAANGVVASEGGSPLPQVAAAAVGDASGSGNAKQTP